jgi:integrase
MEDYQRSLLAENHSKNTVSCYMRSLRAAYKQAMREKVFVKKRQENPFSQVFTGNAKTRKRAIDAESLSRLKQLKPKGADKEKALPCSASVELSRDLFLFSFYTQGMPFSDMANLKKDNIKENMIFYERKKTGQSIGIELEDCMKAIIKRYSDSDSDYIFPILRNCKDGEDYKKWTKTRNALTAYNKNLKSLAKQAGISQHLTSYVSRHTWATLASHEGIPIATISRGMGHDSEKTTRIYISQIDYSDVGRANRQIIAKLGK